MLIPRLKTHSCGSPLSRLLENIHRKANIKSRHVLKGILGNIVHDKLKQKTERVSSQKTKLQHFITKELRGSSERHRLMIHLADYSFNSSVIH